LINAVKLQTPINRLESLIQEKSNVEARLKKLNKRNDKLCQLIGYIQLLLDEEKRQSK